ncbi:MAG: hypothetical protein WC323_02715 [Patescibacteria group bacterium]|jgi:hypothetical protein
MSSKIPAAKAQANDFSNPDNIKIITSPTIIILILKNGADNAEMKLI